MRVAQLQSFGRSLDQGKVARPVIHIFQITLRVGGDFLSVDKQRSRIGWGPML